MVKNARPSLPIIAISGGSKIGPELCLELAEGFGAKAVLQKPFVNSELLLEVKRLLGGGVISSSPFLL